MIRGSRLCGGTSTPHPKPPWSVIADGLPPFDGFPPDEFWAGLEKED